MQRLVGLARRIGWGGRHDRHDTGRMGFNPFRAQGRSNVDVVIAAVTIAVILGMVAWAFLG